MRVTQVYIDGELLDMFDDEQIRVTSSVQNINDISKVFTDYSQTFTVPASNRNNQILSHWYNATLQDGFVAKERKPAKLEINHSLFRRGKIQLEGAEVRDGMPYMYKLTFYGDVVTLKDLFGDDKLTDLDYSGISFTYSYANVKNTITSTSLQDVKFPLISSDRVWEYGDASSEDISTSAGAIVWSELFPAVRDEAIMDAIETTYGITFPGTFINSKENFVQGYTWFKNSDAPQLDSLSTTDITFNGTVDTPVFDNKVTCRGYTKAEIDTIAGGGVDTLISANQQVKITINTAPANEDYTIKVYANGTLINNIQGSGSQTFTVYSLQTFANSAQVDISFELYCVNSGVDFTGSVEHVLSWQSQNTGGAFTSGSDSTSDTIDAFTSTALLSIEQFAPDITVAEWFSGILKSYNCVCVPDGENEFIIQPLEDYYFRGQDIDITQYVIADSIKIDRPKLYRNVEFKYQEPSSFLNLEFNDLFRRHYGNLKNFFGYDSQDFSITLPFETILFNKFTGEDLQVAYSMDRPPDYDKVVPKCTKLYWYTESQTVSFYLNDGTTSEEIVSYVPFGQDTIGFNNQIFTLNFGEEVSSFTLEPEQNSLYQRYYQRYLVNLFSDNTRLITVKTRLPLRLLNYIELNDALIIRDQKYRINEMRSNLNTGEVEFELLTDYTVDENLNFPGIDAGGGTVKAPIEPIKKSKGGEVVIDDDATWISVSLGEKAPYTVTDDTYVTFTVSENTDFTEREHVFTVEYYLPDGTLEKTKYIYFQQEAAVS